MDIYQTPPGMIAALAGAALALGLVFSLVGTYEQPDENELRE
jgi:hypothetical protein